MLHRSHFYKLNKLKYIYNQKLELLFKHLILSNFYFNLHRNFNTLLNISHRDSQGSDKWIVSFGGDTHL